MCVYLKTNGESFVIISLYIDGMPIFETDLYYVEDIESLFSLVFDMKNLNIAKIILGIKITKDDDGTVIS